MKILDLNLEGIKYIAFEGYNPTQWNGTLGILSLPIFTKKHGRNQLNTEVMQFMGHFIDISCLARNSINSKCILDYFIS